MCSHGDDRDMRALRFFFTANFLRRCFAVFLGHGNVHENDIWSKAVGKRYPLDTIAGKDQLDIELF